MSRLGVAALAAAVGLLAVFPPAVLMPIVGPFEWRTFDWYAIARGPLPPPPTITVVAIDEPSLARIGRWPWPRTRTAELVTRLAESGARVIALDLIMSEPDDNSTLAAVRSLAQRYRELGLADASGPGRRFAETLQETLVGADTDAILARAMGRAARVVVPSVFIFPPEKAPTLDSEGRRRLARNRFYGGESAPALQPWRAAGVLLPVAGLHAASKGMGSVNTFPDRDGAVRRVPLVIQHEDGYFPSLSLRGRPGRARRAPPECASHGQRGAARRHGHPHR